MVNYCRNTRIIAYLRHFRPISGGSQLTQSWSKKANLRFLGDHWSVLLQSTGALNPSQADLQLKRADTSPSWWPKKRKGLRHSNGLAKHLRPFFSPSSQIFLPLTPENFGRKSQTSANSKKILSIGTRKKKFNCECWTPIHFLSIFLLEKKFHAQHLSSGYFVFWPKMYGTNLVFFEKILKNVFLPLFLPLNDPRSTE